MSSAMQFNQGDTHKLLIEPGKPHTIHIVAVVDGDMVVYKWYSRHKQRWSYDIKQSSILEFVISASKDYT